MKCCTNIFYSPEDIKRVSLQGMRYGTKIHLSHIQKKEMGMGYGGREPNTLQASTEWRKKNVPNYSGLRMGPKKSQSSALQSKSYQELTSRTAVRISNKLLPQSETPG